MVQLLLFLFLRVVCSSSTLLSCLFSIIFLTFSHSLFVFFLFAIQRCFLDVNAISHLSICSFIPLLTFHLPLCLCVPVSILVSYWYFVLFCFQTFRLLHSLFTLHYSLFIIHLVLFTSTIVISIYLFILLLCLFNSSSIRLFCVFSSSSYVL